MENFQDFSDANASALADSSLLDHPSAGTATVNESSSNVLTVQKNIAPVKELCAMLKETTESVQAEEKKQMDILSSEIYLIGTKLLREMRLG